MTPFDTHKGKVLPLDRSNVDTDAIIPKQYMKSIRKTGYGDFLFDAWRYKDVGELGMNCALRAKNMDFPINMERFKDASILLVRRNFGCGSSREHAAWALKDAGFRVIIGESFADIFYGNAIKNGILPIMLPADVIEMLFEEANSAVGLHARVDLASRALAVSSGQSWSFEISDDVRERLLKGLDDVGISLQWIDDIIDFEAKQREREPWLYS